MAQWVKRLSLKHTDLSFHILSTHHSAKKLGVLCMCNPSTEEAGVSSHLERHRKPGWSRDQVPRTVKGGLWLEVRGIRWVDSRHMLFWVMASPLSEGQPEPTHGVSLGRSLPSRLGVFAQHDNGLAVQLALELVSLSSQSTVSTAPSLHELLFPQPTVLIAHCPHCPLPLLFTVPTAHCPLSPLSTVPTVHCPYYPLSPLPTVHCPHCPLSLKPTFI